jgi:hypothetical protein
MVGMSPRQASDILALGEAHNNAEQITAYSMLYRKVIQAEAQLEETILGVWTREIVDNENWQAAAKYLERRFSKEWNPSSRVDVTTSVGNIQALNDSDLLRLIEETEKNEKLLTDDSAKVSGIIARPVTSEQDNIINTEWTKTKGPSSDYIEEGSASTRIGAEEDE